MFGVGWAKLDLKKNRALSLTWPVCHRVLVTVETRNINVSEIKC